MRKIFFIIVLHLFCSGLVLSQTPIKNPLPSWLFENKKFLMNHSIGFLYSSKDGSLRSLYNNYFTYKVSPRLKFIGNIGYYNQGIKRNSSGGMFQGFGFEYKPNSNLLFHFQYEGMTPIKKTVGSKE